MWLTEKGGTPRHTASRACAAVVLYGERNLNSKLTEIRIAWIRNKILKCAVTRRRVSQRRL